MAFTCVTETPFLIIFGMSFYDILMLKPGSSIIIIYRMFGSEYWIYYFPKYWQQDIKVSLWCINIFWLFYLKIEWMQLQRSLHWGLWRKIMQLINWHIESHLTTSSRDNKCIGLGWTLLLFDLSIFLFSWKKWWVLVATHNL